MHQGLFGISKSRNSVQIHQYFLWAVKTISGMLELNYHKRELLFVVVLDIYKGNLQLSLIIEGICTQMTNTLNVAWIGNLLSGIIKYSKEY